VIGGVERRMSSVGQVPARRQRKNDDVARIARDAVTGGLEPPTVVTYDPAHGVHSQDCSVELSAVVAAVRRLLQRCLGYSMVGRYPGPAQPQPARQASRITAGGTARQVAAMGSPRSRILSGWDHDRHAGQHEYSERNREDDGAATPATTPGSKRVTSIMAISG